jgi:hypothetical protein
LPRVDPAVDFCDGVDEPEASTEPAFDNCDFDGFDTMVSLH